MADCRAGIDAPAEPVAVVDADRPTEMEAVDEEEVVGSTEGDCV